MGESLRTGATDGDRVLFHGSTGSGLIRDLAPGAPVCLTVTHLDGLVPARSAFKSSNRPGPAIPAALR